MIKFFEKPNSQLYGIGFFFIVTFIIFYPTNILIFDEWKYFQQGLAYSMGDSMLHDTNPILMGIGAKPPGEYPVGTPFFLASLIFLFGKKAVFMQGLISLVGAYYFNIKTLKNLNLDTRFSLLLFFFFPATFLSRTLMSDLPSLLMISWFLFLITKSAKSELLILGAGFVGGLSILFREPNVILILPFLIGFYFRENVKIFLISAIGFLIAIILRLASSFWAFGTPFFLKDPGIPFSTQFLIENAIFYVPFLLIFIPAGLLALYKYGGSYKVEMKVALILFLGLYFFYGYNGIQFSGIKSLVLGPRFLIPTLPFFAIMVAKLCKSEFKFIRKILIPCSVVCIVVSQFVGSYYNSAQQEAFLGLENKGDKVHLIAELNTVPKIFFPSSDNFPKIYLEDSLLIEGILERDTFMYVETSSRKDNEVANNHTMRANQNLDKVLRNFKREEIFQYTLPDRIVIRQYKISK